MKILFTTPILGHPAAGGPKLRIENSIKALSTLSELHLFSRQPREAVGGKEAIKFYEEYCYSFNYVPSVAPYSLKNHISRKMGFLTNDADAIIKYALRNDINIIWFGFGNISYNLMKSIKMKRPNLKIVCDTDSVWSRFILRELPFETNLKRRAEIERQGRIKEDEEREGINLCEVTTAVSDIDAKYYRAIARETERVRIFSNGIDLKDYNCIPPKPEGFKKPCIFLAGTFWENSPMEKSARWIIEKVLPLIKRNLPDIHFYIIGIDSDKVLNNILDEDITVTGKVESVLPYLCHSDVAIVPLMFESGTRFKILEAGACGVPIVSTTLGAEGIPVTDGKDILIADEPETFAEGIVKLILDKTLADTLAKNCKSLVAQHYSVESLSLEAEGILDYLKSL